MYRRLIASDTSSLYCRNRDWQTVNKPFVGQSVYHSVIHFKATMESVVGWSRVTLFITSFQNESPSLFLGCFRAFCSLARLHIECYDHCLAVFLESGFETSEHLIVDHWFYFNRWKVLHRLDALLAASLYRSSRTMKLFLSWLQIGKCVLK